MHLCRWMRWKAYYHVDLFDETELAAHYARNEVPWECLRTCASSGPDGGLVVPEDCGPDRGCFAPSPKLVRRTS